jgi:hypothetical protein
MESDEEAGQGEQLATRITTTQQQLVVSGSVL